MISRCRGLALQLALRTDTNHKIIILLTVERSPVAIEYFITRLDTSNSTRTETKSIGTALSASSIEIEYIMSVYCYFLMFSCRE